MRCQPEHGKAVYIWTKNNQFCLLCDEPADSGLSLCGPCENELPWLGEQCSVCALPLAVDGLACGACLQRPPAFSRVETPWRYDFPLDALVTRFKHQAKWPLGRLLADGLSRHLQHAFGEGLPRPDCLLPVPLAKRRLRQRGFNQAALLARWLGTGLQLAVDERLLQRVLETPAQQGLDAATRQRNLRRAFALANPAAVAGRHLALVDDVLTTGATAQSLARLLRQAGAARVDVYCLARTAKPGD
ncbi:ComF family protein [Pseudomonas cavernae]|uniref:ComF family protein n=1 Tax=Pseudomonas cavernae TaxID=2320867 RepID=A0A385YXT4_9PSED|nr:ComF family protein [Pseudomonas cavernae]AYC31261.1 ComF family protein [Pseudomonas cavernae]